MLLKQTGLIGLTTSGHETEKRTSWYHSSKRWLVQLFGVIVYLNLCPAFFYFLLSFTKWTWRRSWRRWTPCSASPWSRWRVKGTPTGKNTTRLRTPWLTMNCLSWHNKQNHTENFLSQLKREMGEASFSSQTNRTNLTLTGLIKEASLTKIWPDLQRLSK